MTLLAQTLRMSVPYACAALGGVWSETQRRREHRPGGHPPLRRTGWRGRARGDGKRMGGSGGRRPGRRGHRRGARAHRGARRGRRDRQRDCHQPRRGGRNAVRPARALRLQLETRPPSTGSAAHTWAAREAEPCWSVPSSIRSPSPPPCWWVPASGPSPARASAFGVRACGEDPVAAASVGVDVRRVRLRAVSLGARSAAWEAWRSPTTSTSFSRG